MADSAAQAHRSPRLNQERAVLALRLCSALGHAHAHACRAQAFLEPLCPTQLSGTACIRMTGSITAWQLHTTAHDDQQYDRASQAKVATCWGGTKGVCGAGAVVTVAAAGCEVS